MYKYANPEHTFVNCKSKGEYGIHPGVWKWAEVERWVAEGNTIEPFETPTEKLENAKKTKESAIRQEKIVAKSKGIVVDGILFDTDDAARLSYIEFMLKQMINPSYTVSEWKASEGVWVTMDAILFGKLMTAWEARLTSLFSFVKTKENELKSKNTVKAIQVIDTEYKGV